MDAPPVQYVTTPDGFNIAYTVSGAGPAFMHMPYRWSHLQFQWQPHLGDGRFREQLSERFTLVCYDSRGQGLSTRGLPEDVSLDDYERDLEALIEHLGLTRFILFGPNNSGRVAIRYAARHPERVSALVLWNCTIEGPQRLDQMADFARDDWDGFLEVVARSMPGDYSASILNQMATQPDWLRPTARSSVKTFAPKVRTPALILATRANPLSHEQSGEQLAALIPGARLALFDETSAGVFTLEAGMLPATRAIDSFLAKLGAGVPAEAPASFDAAPAHLTPRELEVLRLVAQGKSNRQIAEALVISRNTVLRHLNHIFNKTGAANRVEATNYVHRHHLV